MPLYSFVLPVEPHHCEGGRLEHLALLEILKKARLSFLDKHKMQEDHIVPDVGFVIGELNVRYTGAAREGDVLEVSLSIKDIAEKKCSLVYSVRTLPDKKSVATASTVIVFVDMKLEQSTAIPDAFLKLVGENPAKKTHGAFFGSASQEAARPQISPPSPPIPSRL